MWSNTFSSASMSERDEGRDGYSFVWRIDLLSILWNLSVSSLKESNKPPLDKVTSAD